jgi:hypothetical protein
MRKINMVDRKTTSGKVPVDGADDALTKRMQQLADRLDRAAKYQFAPDQSVLATRPTIWDVAAYRAAVEESSRWNQGLRTVSAGEGATEPQDSATAQAPDVSQRPSAGEVAEATFRLVAGFKARLEDLINGWVPPGHQTGARFASVSRAGARGHGRSELHGSDAAAPDASQPAGPIVKASWVSQLRWLDLEWVDTAQTAPLKESGAVEVFLEQGGQRRQVPANFRPIPDGSVDIRYVAVHLSQEDAAALSGAEVEVAWLSDAEGNFHRLVVVFRTGGL